MTGKNALAARKRGVQGEWPSQKNGEKHAEQLANVIFLSLHIFSSIFQTKCLLRSSKQILPLSFKIQLSLYKSFQRSDNDISGM
jgi:hypothetical protein